MPCTLVSRFAATISRQTNRVVLRRVELNRPSLSLGCLAGFLKLLLSLSTQLPGLALYIIDSTPRGIELFPDLLRRLLFFVLIIPLIKGRLNRKDTVKSALVWVEKRHDASTTSAGRLIAYLQHILQVQCQRCRTMLLTQWSERSYPSSSTACNQLLDVSQ